MLTHKVLLIDSFHSDHIPIKFFMERQRAQKYIVSHFNSFGRALAFLREETVDIILMAIGAGEHDIAEQFFNELQTDAANVPVIILSRDDDFEIAKQYVEAGADNVLSRERFLDKPEDLIYAIDFAMMRRENQSINVRKSLLNFESKHYNDLSEEQQETADRIQNLHSEGSKNIKEIQVIAATNLKEALAKAATSLKDEQLKHATALKHLQAAHMAELKLVSTDKQEHVDNYRQIYFWMHGGYSMEEFVSDTSVASLLPQANKESNAADLKTQQESDAFALKEAQEQYAGAQETKDDATARDVLYEQEHTALRLHARQDAIARTRNSQSETIVINTGKLPHKK